MKRLLLPFVLCFASFASMEAQEKITLFDFQDPYTNFGYTNPTETVKASDLSTEATFTKDAVSFNVKKGTGSTTSLRFYWNVFGTTLRFYSGDTVTLTTLDNSLISKVKITTWKYYVHVSCNGETLQWSYYGPDGNDPSLFVYSPAAPVSKIQFVGITGKLEDIGNVSSGQKDADAQNYFFTTKVYTTDASGVTSVKADDIPIVTLPGQIQVLSDTPNIAVYSMAGVLISKNQAIVNVPAGIYVVKVDGQVQKVSVK